MWLFNILFILLLSESSIATSENKISWNFSRGDHQSHLERTKRSDKGKSSLLSQCSDLKGLCAELKKKDDLSVLECIQSYQSTQITDLSEDCQHALWSHTKDLLDDTNLRILLDKDCVGESVIANCIKEADAGGLFACVIDHRDLTQGACHHLINQIEWVAFSDYRVVTPFVKACSKDIEIQKCGRLEPQKETLSQGKTLACLQSKIAKLDGACQHQVLHLSEIQTDNLKLDRQLYMACATDHLNFCRDFHFGEGLVFKCLSLHKNDPGMTQNCREQLSRRQKLIARDYRVSRGLARACKEDIRNSRCRKGVSENKDIRLAQMLLCLEGVIRNGTKVNPDCQLEIIDHRKMLLEDYHLSPEIVDGCAKDILDYCNELDVGGKTIHCLMEHARPKRKKRVSSKCLRALEDLVKQTDVGEDWRVDPVLREACKSVVDISCKEVRGGDSRVMSCLMDKVGTDHMTDPCENALVQIQYFVARDFKLDPKLYRGCRDDAVKLCHAKKNWDDFGESHAPENAPMVLPCLYRYAYHPNQTLQLQQSCLAEIRRVMRQRAISVDLQPEIEEVCLDDLAMYCYEKTARGEETQCLQNNLDNLQPKCKTAVSSLIEEQAEHVELNPVIRTVCLRMMTILCAPEMRLKDEGDLMECLVSHKNHPEMRTDIKCRAAVEHFQLISLKNYHFTYKFKEACKPYVINFCPKARTKADVIECLSERIRNDTLASIRNSIPKECRQQLRAQLFQQRENIDLDPKLKSACNADIKVLCDGVEHGSSRVLECLSSKSDKLSGQCHRAIFRVKKLEMMDSSIDYTLITVCHDMIKTFCFNTDKSKALECLKLNKDDKIFDQKCKMVVLQRMIEQNKDYRLNPALHAACSKDINAYCKDILLKQLKVGDEEKELNSKIIKCLKDKFREAKLEQSCENQMAIILREQALNINLNPLLRTLCAKELEVLCKPTNDNLDDNTGDAEECLKTALMKKQIVNIECKMEVAAMIEEAKADIHVDPLLQRACSYDLMRFCKDIPQGAGRHLNCLKQAMDNSDTGASLMDECKDKLLKRIEMFRTVDTKLPEGIQELYTQVAASPSKRYFVMVAITIIGVIFITGLFCGRFTKKQIAMKNK